MFEFTVNCTQVARVADDGIMRSVDYADDPIIDFVDAPLIERVLAALMA